jgi:hypothetical protein
VRVTGRGLLENRQAFPKPKDSVRQKKPAVIVYPDGREVCRNTDAGRREYSGRTGKMWIRDKGVCCLCGESVSLMDMTFEHKQGRGMGGAKRDDRESMNGISHWAGNGAKGSKGYEKYMQLPLEQRIRNCGGRT